MNVKNFEDQRRFGERLNDALAKRWKLAVFLLLLLIVGMAGILLLDSYFNKAKIASAELAEDIQAAFNEWVEQEPEERNSEELDTLIDKAIAEHPKRFSAQRAEFTRARMQFEKEEWSQSAESFSQFSHSWPDSHLAPSSLFNAAAAYEEAGNLDEARNSLLKLIELYGEVSPQIAEAMFALGRMAESEIENDAALKQYKDLISRFPNSRWHDLAKSRVLKIES